MAATGIPAGGDSPARDLVTQQAGEMLPADPSADDGGKVAATIERVRRADRAREGFPGEHWLVLGLGVAIWQVTRRDRHWAVRTLGAVAASMLAARAASGRDGLAKVLRYTPLGGRISRCPPCDTAAANRRP